MMSMYVGGITHHADMPPYLYEPYQQLVIPVPCPTTHTHPAPLLS